MCLNTVGHVLEYEETPDDVSELMKKRFSGLEDYAIADTFVARAGLLDAETGTVGIKVPALLLVRDTANGAANRAEQAARG